jgi:hypothetical protein
VCVWVGGCAGFWHSHMGWLFDEQLSLSRVGPKGNVKQDNASVVPWFYKESPGFYQWLRETYMYHMLGQVQPCPDAHVVGE